MDFCIPQLDINPHRLCTVLNAKPEVGTEPFDFHMSSWAHAYAYHILELSETVAGRGISQAPEEVLIESEALDSNPIMKNPVMGNTLGDPQVWSPREAENTIKHDKTYLDNPPKKHGLKLETEITSKSGIPKVESRKEMSDEHFLNFTIDSTFGHLN